MSLVSSPFDTIVAPITAPGRGAVAAVRLSGPQAWQVGRMVFATLPENPTPRLALYGRFTHGDDGLALPFEQGASYTGEESLELFIHGSPTSVRLLLDACLKAGARSAEPGEFTLRAFANGRLDLSQAEAVVEVVDAQTGAQFRAAGAQLEGALTRSLQPLLEQLETVLVRLEATLDFSEEIGELNYPETAKALQQAQMQLAQIARWERPSQLLREGLTVALVGAPNAGKSSLFNALAGSDRAIVTDIPGTTRDVLEATIDVRGIPVTLTDTAGLRESADQVEQIGMQRAQAAARKADVILYLFDCQKGLTMADREALKNLENPITLATKADLPHSEPYPQKVSAKTGQGLQDLLDRLTQKAETTELPFLLNPRHGEKLRDAQNALNEAVEATQAEMAPDLILPSLYHTTDQLRQILGVGVAPNVIEAIFARFCIGK